MSTRMSTRMSTALGTSAPGARTDPADGPPGTSLDPTRRALWAGARGPLVVAALVLAAAFVLAVVGSGARSGTLDPRAVDRRGSKALAELLRDQGVDVRLVQTTAAAEAEATDGSTLLVAIPDLLVDSQLRRVAATRADLVLVGPGPSTLDVLTPEISGVAVEGGELEREPSCAWQPAVRAGEAEVGEAADYTVAPKAGDSVQLCYPRADAVAVVQLERADGSSVTVLGSGRPLTNERLGNDGNAALSLGALGRNDRLVWYLPSLSDVPAGERESLWSLLPAGIRYAVAQLVVAGLVLAAWRARRLGPVVPEPLPVVVRAAESVEGRARLYRRAGARGSAAAALRRDAIARLGGPLGLPRRADPPAVVDAVASRTGRAPCDVGPLLYGAAPTDDAALVRLADDLDRLDREVRHP